MTERAFAMETIKREDKETKFNDRNRDKRSRKLMYKGINEIEIE